MASLKACAKKKSFQELLISQLKVSNSLNFLPFPPVVDGYFMPGMCYFKINVALRRNLYFWFTTKGGFSRIIPT